MKKKYTTEIVVNHEGTEKGKNGEDNNGLEITSFKIQETRRKPILHQQGRRFV